MKKDFRTLVCVAALIGAMTTGISYALDVSTELLIDNTTETYNETVSIIAPDGKISTTESGILNVNGTLNNGNLIDNNGQITGSTLQNETDAVINGNGQLSFGSGENKGSITQDIIAITDSNGTFTNSGNITSKTFNNSAKILGNGSLEISGGTNSNDITQGTVTINGDYTNNGTITAANLNNNNKLTGNGSLTINDGTNAGTIEQDNITINNEFTNNNKITVSNTLTNNKTFNNNNSATTNKLENAAGSTIAGNGSLTIDNGNNYGDITQNELKIIGSNGDFINSLDSSITTNIFENSANIYGDAAGNGNLTINTKGTNNGSIVMNDITLAGTFNNNNGADLTALGTLTNNGILNNRGTVKAWGNKMVNNGTVNNYQNFDFDSTAPTHKILENNGTFINSGTVAQITGASVINKGAFTVTNGANASLFDFDNGNGTINILNGSRLEIRELANDLSGKINVVGDAGRTNSIYLTGTSTNINANLAIGNGTKNSTLILGNDINILDSATLNITNAGHLVIGNNSSAVLNNGDSVLGDITLNDGTLTLDGFNLMSGEKSTQNGGNGGFYQQTDGTLNIINNSSLNMKNPNYITGGDMNIDKYSQFIASGEANGGFSNLDNLNISGKFNAMNNDIGDYNIDHINIGQNAIGDTSNSIDFTVDFYARQNTDDRRASDKFIGSEINGDGTINISDWSLGGDLYGWDAPIDRHFDFGKLFDYGTINGSVNMTAVEKEVFTPIGWYKLNNAGTGIGSGYTLDLSRFNPQVYRGQVVTVAQWMNQLAINDMLFTHSMVLPSFKDEDGGVSQSMTANRYAATSPLYAPYQYSRKDGGLWYKMYGNFEHLQMNNNLKVGNNAYGALIGADFGLKELRNGWKFMPTAYIGYNGAHQTFANMGAYQNGGQAGFLGTWYKDNLIIGGLVYGGIYDNTMDVRGNTDNTFNYFAGASAKAAYNIRLHRDLVLQPNLFVGYNFIGQQNWHSTFGQMGMMAGMLHGVNVAPGVNLIWEKETFSTYLTLQYMYNVNGAVTGRAGNVELPQMEMERGYIQYGIGFTKKFTDRASGYMQAVLRNAGRTGAGFQLGFNFLLGK